MEQEFELIAKTFQGLEEVLAGELTEIGANNIQIGRRMVSFTGTRETMYRANYALRTAIRILKPLKHFKATTADEVYDAVKNYDWASMLDLKTTFAVGGVLRKFPILQVRGLQGEGRHCRLLSRKGRPTP